MEWLIDLFDDFGFLVWFIIIAKFLGIDLNWVKARPYKVLIGIYLLFFGARIIVRLIVYWVAL